MALRIGKDADFLQICLSIVASGMFSSWCLCTDDHNSIGNLFIWNFHYLYEVLDEGIYFMETILDPLQKLLEHSPFLDADIVWNYHVVESACAFHRRVMDIELREDWILTI